MTEQLTKVSTFLEEVEATTTDTATAKKIRKYMDDNKLWASRPAIQENVDPEPLAQIVYNAVTCLACGETIESRYRHDYKTCGCENNATVDGGYDYTRYGAVNMAKIIKTTLSMDDDFEKLRKYVSWGTYGKTGKDPLTYKRLKDMSNEHLANVISYHNNQEHWMIKLMHQELEYRQEKNIIIND